MTRSRTIGFDGQDYPASLWFLGAVALSGLAAATAVELGWVTTEVGRQPWIVYGVLRVANAVNPEPGVQDEVWAVGAVYAALTVVTIVVLRRLAYSTRCQQFRKSTMSRRRNWRTEEAPDSPGPATGREVERALPA